MNTENNEYILFLDETAKTAANPYFCLGGFICSRKEYDKITQSVTDLKTKHSIPHNIPLHYTDIKNFKNGFEIFKEDTQARTKLMNDIVNIYSSIDIITLGVYFNQSDFKNLYGKKLYDIAFFELLRNYTYFLKETNGVGSICIESRSFKENAYVQDVYYSFLQNGNSYFDKEIANRHLTSISFSIKSDNCTGLQLADFIPVVFTRSINKNKDTYKLGQVILSKLYKNGSEFERYVGLKELT